MDNIGLNVTTIRLPIKPQFPKVVEQLIHACHAYRQIKNKPSAKAQAERYLHCHTLIEGLYQTWCCQSPKARLDVFLSPRYYHSKEFGKINNLTQHYVEETVATLEQLGWVEVVVGRRLTTIDTLPTQLKAIGEIDFSELHPRLLYMSQNLAPPTGDLYDIGLLVDGMPYDAKAEPYKTQRGIVKEVFNALLNDESGSYRLSTKKVKQVGLSFGKLKKLILKRHPPLKAVLGKGVGLSFQYVDSQIAEQVMLELLGKGITCLPVHDSFIVPRHQGQELTVAMNKAFARVTGVNLAKLKPPSNYKSDFLMTFLPNGELDREAMFKMHEEAIHNHFIQSRLQAIKR